MRTAHRVQTRSGLTGRRVATPGALLPPADPIEHRLTLDLINALITAGWRATGIGVASATLRHPFAHEPIRVFMNESDTSRLSSVHIGDREVSFRAAIEYAQAPR